MKMFTKALEAKLQKAFGTYSTDEDPMILGKIFNPYGGQTWYLMNQDPEDPEYLWGVAILFADIGPEMGGMPSKTEFETTTVPPFNGNLERDKYFTPMKYSELMAKLNAGTHV
jgi:hypothetical protein